MAKKSNPSETVGMNSPAPSRYGFHWKDNKIVREGQSLTIPNMVLDISDVALFGQMLKALAKYRPLPEKK